MHIDNEMNGISIVVITYNSAASIEACVDSIFAQRFRDYEVIIIDNASIDHTREILRRNYSNILLKENPENYGFCKALNQGITESRNREIVCLNDDVRLNDDFLMNICNAAGADEGIGAVQPKVIRSDGRIDTAGINLSVLRRLHNIGSGEIDRGQFNKRRYIFGASGAAVLYRRTALESIRDSNGEYFDEDFFCIAEDVDISWRLQKKGWKTLYCPEAVCVHRGGISRKKEKISQYFSMRNRYFMILKNESLVGGLFRLSISFFFYDLWRNVYMAVINPRYFLKASYEVMKLLPKMIKKRQKGSA